MRRAGWVGADDVHAKGSGCSGGHVSRVPLTELKILFDALIASEGSEPSGNLSYILEMLVPVSENPKLHAS